MAAEKKGSISEDFLVVLSLLEGRVYLELDDLEISGNLCRFLIHDHAGFGVIPSFQDVSGRKFEIWEEFAKWVRSLKRHTLDQSGKLRDLYIENLVKSGVTMEEAKQRLARIDVLRGQTLDRERIYWDGKHKLGDSPSEPLDHVRDALRGLRPGKALDVAMGNGRHAIFLAKLGWDATGYDFSSESVRSALALAANAGVKITAVQATHDTFDFGVNQWNLIIVTYPYYDTMNSAWPPRLWRATKSGGHVIFKGVANEGSTLAEFAELWRPFHLIQCEITETGEDWFEGRESRTVKIIALKKRTEN